MKLMYLRLEGIEIGDRPELDQDALLELFPPDLESSCWDLKFKNDITLYTDGKVTVVVQDEEEQLPERTGRIRREIKPAA